MHENAAHYKRLKTAYSEIQAILPATSGDERLRLLGQAGTFAQELAEYEQAKVYFERAIHLAQEQHRPRFEVANLIRLGICYFEMRELQMAEEIYTFTLERISTTPETESYRDFALFHVGRLLLDQGLLNEAKEVFKAVLIMRQQKGDSELIASTQAALQTIQKIEHGEEPFSTF